MKKTLILIGNPAKVGDAYVRICCPPMGDYFVATYPFDGDVPSAALSAPEFLTHEDDEFLRAVALPEPEPEVRTA